MYRQIEKILGDSRYDLFHFRDHHSLVQLIKGSTEKFRPKRIIYHFTDVSFDRGRIDTRYITRDLRRLIPRLYILGIYRSNEDTEKILLSNGVSHALKHSSRRGSEFEQSLQELLL
jgi:hypothetical protein